MFLIIRLNSKNNNQIIQGLKTTNTKSLKPTIPVVSIISPKKPTNSFLSISQQKFVNDSFLFFQNDCHEDQNLEITKQLSMNKKTALSLKPNQLTSSTTIEDYTVLIQNSYFYKKTKIEIFGTNWLNFYSKDGYKSVKNWTKRV